LVRSTSPFRRRELGTQHVPILFGEHSSTIRLVALGGKPCKPPFQPLTPDHFLGQPLFTIGGENPG
jgi:hypothetical protein